MSLAITCSARIGFPAADTPRLCRYSSPSPSDDAAPSGGGALFSPISRHDASSPAAEPMLRFISSSLAPAWCLWRSGVDHGFDGADELESGGDGRCDIAIIIIKNVKTTTTNKQQQTTKRVLNFVLSCEFIVILSTMPAPATASGSTTTKPIFPADQLRTWIRQLLATTLRDVVYDHAHPGRMKDLSRGLSEKIKSQMLTLQPHSFKYIITATLTENKNQAGRGDLVCHWQGTDVAVQEMFSNVRLRSLSPLLLMWF